jgi:hypothetical protein
MNILTADEAATVLRCAEDDQLMLDLLDQVDAYINNATGWDWRAEYPEEAYPEAKSAARMLLVKWHENPGMAGSAEDALSFGLRAALMQLKALALELAELEESA